VLAVALAAGLLAALAVRQAVPSTIVGSASPAPHLGTVDPNPPSAPAGPTTSASASTSAGPSTGPSTGPSAGPSGSATGSPPAGPSGSPSMSPPPVPAGYRLYAQTGYSIALPANWWVSHEVGGRPHGDLWSTPFNQPGQLLAFVEVQAAPGTAPTATAALSAYERARGHDPGYRVYQRLLLAGRARIPGAADVADLEFTDRHEAQVIHYHTLVRAVRTQVGRVFLIMCHVEHNTIRDDGSTEDDWRKLAPTVATILGTFRLA
jgi:hypothetical protein